MGEKVVLFGGTFDPVHNGHLIAARRVAERRRFKRITLVPAASPPHKDPARAAGRHRLNMLRLAVEGEQMFEVCDVELRRAGPSFTFDTLSQVRDSRGGNVPLCWLIGADMLEQVHTWHRAAEVVEAAEIITMVRPPWDRRLPEILEALAEHFRPEQVRRLRDSIVQTPLLEISSGEIRDRVRRGRSIRLLVPEAVRAYIEAERLYRGGAEGQETP